MFPDRAPLIINKSLKCSTWMQTQKRQNDLSSFPRQIIQHHSNPGLCPNHWCQRSWSGLWRPTRHPRTTTKRWCPIHHKGLECKSWSQEIPGVTGKFGLEYKMKEANGVLSREHAGHNKHPLPTKQEKTLYMDITRWSTPKSDWLYFFAAKDGEALNSQKKQHQELTVAQTMNSLLSNSDWNWRKYFQ